MQLPPQPGTAGGGVCLWRPGFSWRMYRGVIATSSGVAEVCVETTCVLHNFLRAKRLQRWRRRRQEEPDVDPSPALEALREGPRTGPNNAVYVATNV